MLSLLIKTRLQYYRNYIRCHFDRITIIEIVFIFLVFLLLTIRSPADIGYNFSWMYKEDFPVRWAGIYSILLPFFYIISEIFAIYTLRPSKEWQLLGTLPFTVKSIANYYVFRHFSKTAILLISVSLPFWGGLMDSTAIRTMRFFTALGLLLTLQLVAFIQAYAIRNPLQHLIEKIIRWLLFETVILGTLVFSYTQLQNILSGSANIKLFGLSLIWIISFTLLVFIQRTFTLRDAESKVFKKSHFINKAHTGQRARIMKGIIRTFIIRDILFLWRLRRSSFLIPIIGILILSTIVMAEENAGAVYISLIFVEIFLSLLLMNTVLSLFEQDAEKMDLIRSLPITAATLWFSRWLFIVAFVATQMFVPLIIILFKFSTDLDFILFMLTGVAIIPMLMATIYCNSGFGLFPHIKLCGFIITLSIILIFLFWFFMPFGSIILLAVMFFWIRKSQRHFQFLETP